MGKEFDKSTMVANNSLSHDENLAPFFHNKNILVTGGTGSIGSEIVSMLLKYNPKKIVVFNKDDTKQYLMQQKYNDVEKVEFILGDIRNYQSVVQAMKNIDYVFHTAALKQVPICEKNPMEAIQTNIHGSQNVIDAAIENNVKKVINISTDKVVNPTNIMGMTKLITEKLFKYANDNRNNKNTLFCSVRFGNVIGSRGSVIPLFINKVKNHEPITVTDPNMTRFIMSIPEAVHLTLLASYYSQGGETFIIKMKSLKIADLVEAMKTYCKQQNFPIPQTITIGPRLGEKKYEELIMEDECDFVLENDRLYVILPNNESAESYKQFQQANITSLRSDRVPFISQEEIVEIINRIGVSQ